MSISSTIRSIQATMRQDVGVDGDAQRLGQLVWMLFLKIFDDREMENELSNSDYKSPIPNQFRWRSWATDSKKTGDELTEFINNQLFPCLRSLDVGTQSTRAALVRSVFESTSNYMKSGHLIRQVICKLHEGIDFSSASCRHDFGDIYEQLLSDLQSAGNAGEYYTPRALTEFMVHMLNPKLGEIVFDPACGTGGFLSCALKYIRKNDVKTIADEQLLQACIYGMEKKPLPHLLCTTNMLLHGIEVPTNIQHGNSLVRPYSCQSAKAGFDVILTNPPFGGVEEEGVAKNFPASFQSRESSDMFLVLLISLLRDGGRAAVVLPDGTLFGVGVKTRIKEWMLRTCNLHTIVRLPRGVFSPYTNIKCNLLFLTKGAPTAEVWYYDHPYPVGVTKYCKTRPINIDEFAPEAAWWGEEANGFEKRIENEFAWKITLESIKTRNFNLDCRNPYSPEPELHNLDKLLAEYYKLQDEITATTELLKNAIAVALESQ